jgi:hypothetical protein
VSADCTQPVYDVKGDLRRDRRRAFLETLVVDRLAFEGKRSTREARILAPWSGARGPDSGRGDDGFLGKMLLESGDDLLWKRPRASIMNGKAGVAV